MHTAAFKVTVQCLHRHDSVLFVWGIAYLIHCHFIQSQACVMTCGWGGGEGGRRERGEGKEGERRGEGGREERGRRERGEGKEGDLEKG